MENKQAIGIVKFIKDLCAQGKNPEEIITDNGKEFCNDQLLELFRNLEIRHRKVGVESHRSNDRVENTISSILSSEYRSSFTDLFNAIKFVVTRISPFASLLGEYCSPTSIWTSVYPFSINFFIAMSMQSSSFFSVDYISFQLHADRPLYLSHIYSCSLHFSS